MTFLILGGLGSFLYAFTPPFVLALWCRKAEKERKARERREYLARRRQEQKEWARQTGVRNGGR